MQRVSGVKYDSTELKQLLIIIGLATFAGGAGVGTAFAQVGNITRIEIPGASSTYGWAINNSGQIVGTYVTSGPSALGESDAYLRTPAGTSTQIEDPKEKTDPWGAINPHKLNPSGINDTGQIVGNFQDHDGKEHGFLRTPVGDFTTIDAPGEQNTDAHGINNAGQIVGSYQDAGGKWHGFLRTPGGIFTTIDAPGAGVTVASGINDTGQIVGQFQDAGGKWHGYLRTAGGTFTTIDPPGAGVTGASGINNAGQIVGGFFDANHSKAHGYLRTAGGTFITIDAPGAGITAAEGINNAGQIVGLYQDVLTSTNVYTAMYHGYVTAPAPAQ